MIICSMTLMMNSQKNIYRPLPENTTILKSNIEGLGLFATEDIHKNKTLGVSHVKHHDYLNGFIRTPLGGFVNHSEEPNCKLREVGHEMYLQTIKSIRKGEELTLKYQLYNPVKFINE